MSLESLRIRNKEGVEGQTRKRVAPPSILWETLSLSLGESQTLELGSLGSEVGSTS